MSGDTTRIAQHRVVHSLPREACLVQIYGPSLGRRTVLDQVETTIGRGDTCTITLDDDSVSRTHAKIVITNDEACLYDLGSTNGSFVNDDEIKEAVLANGDMVKLGSVIFKYISGGNAEALYHEEIYRMTITDGLTGVPNRRYLEDFLERELARAQRYERPLALAMLDVDHFKTVNDVHGHLAGDFVLRRIAQEASEMVRREELLARYGGEEFALVMPETDLPRARQFGEKIRRAVETLPFEFDGKRIDITISVGIAAPPAGLKSASAFIGIADEQLYRAKREGRNRVCVVGDVE